MSRVQRRGPFRWYSSARCLPAIRVRSPVVEFLRRGDAKRAKGPGVCVYFVQRRFHALLACMLVVRYLDSLAIKKQKKTQKKEKEKRRGCYARAVRCRGHAVMPLGGILNTARSFPSASRIRGCCRLCTATGSSAAYPQRSARAARYVLVCDRFCAVERARCAVSSRCRTRR